MLMLRFLSVCNLRFICQNIRHQKMGTETSNNLIFAQKFNPISGKIEWEAQNEDFDYHQEIARSAYGDMLHDTERNQLYEIGLKWAITKLRKEGRPVRVLDIGTGTGLLAMFACRLGADQVTACEAFRPVASCARRIINENGFADKVHLVSKRSTELKVGPGCDLEERATILVTEVFDTELIGEGAILTFNHAHQHLLEKDCLVVPSRARIYCQLVQSELLRNCHRHRDVKITEQDFITVPKETNSCHGSAAVLDIQMSQLPIDSFKLLTKPFKTWSFDFTGKNKILTDESFDTMVRVHTAGQCDAFFFYWDIDMDEDGETTLSCAPWWNHPKGREQPWRDHWMQAVYFPLNSYQAKTGEDIKISCFHDEYSFWFDIQQSSAAKSNNVLGKRPACTCGLHMVCNPQRISTLNDVNIYNVQIKVLKKFVDSESICVSVGNGASMLPLIAAKLGAKKVYVIDASRLSGQILHLYLEANNLKSKIKIINKSCEDLQAEDFDGNKISLVISEPYFLSSYLPWHDIALWYSVNRMKQFLKSSFKLIPNVCRIWALGMNFKHLWKTRAPLRNVEGFNMNLFDELVQNSMSISDPLVEPYSLWEYEGVALTQPFQLLTCDLTTPITDDLVFSSEGSVTFENSSTCNGVAIWTEWELDEKSNIVRGPTKPVTCGENVEWDFNTKQGVYFISNKSVDVGQSLSYSLHFNPKTFTYDLQFSI